MSLRISHNTNALSAHRNLREANDRVSKSLERLSSGLRINSADDGATKLIASEQLRAQVASIDQAIENSESSISMTQTAEGALTEVNNILVAMRQLALQSANEGVNDDVMLIANQTSIESLIDSIDRVAEFTLFGKRKLLDGSNSVSGTTTGNSLTYVKASKETQSSGPKGYDVLITQIATKASLKGSNPLTKEIINAGDRLTVTESGKTATYVTKQSDTVDDVVLGFSSAAKAAGLDVSIFKTQEDTVMIEHNRYGSEHSFAASSTTAGVISEEANTLQKSAKGVDLQGTINGEATIGKGTTITGIHGNANTDGLTVRYHPGRKAVITARGEPTVKDGQESMNAVETATIPEEGRNVGKVNVVQNALTFQIGPLRGQTVDIVMPNMAVNSLARGVNNASGFDSLADINVTSAEKATDSLALIDAAINQVTKVRADLGAFQNNTLATNVANMRIAKENMVAAESNIRDTDMAAEVAEFTRHNLIMQSSAAMLAQANQVPGNVLRLLE